MGRTLGQDSELKDKPEKRTFLLWAVYLFVGLLFLRVLILGLFYLSTLVRGFTDDNMFGLGFLMFGVPLIVGSILLLSFLYKKLYKKYTTSDIHFSVFFSFISLLVPLTVISYWWSSISLRGDTPFFVSLIISVIMAFILFSLTKRWIWKEDRKTNNFIKEELSDFCYFNKWIKLAILIILLLAIGTFFYPKNTQINSCEEACPPQNGADVTYEHSCTGLKIEKNNIIGKYTHLCFGLPYSKVCPCRKHG